uniref:hypothetical protein n=1 Tax=uncultured Corynebacterium sp. TaxID=159447 RepID=UPI0025FBB7AA|nr:hypothetical protein [uncultured Corynebacterium sp.]
MANTEINTLKDEYGISAPTRQGFNVKARIETVDDGTLDSLVLGYTHEATGTTVFFTTKLAYKDGKPYCTFHANRSLDLNQEETAQEIIRELHEHPLAWQCNFDEHAKPLYLGSKGSALVPMDNSGDEDEFITLFRRTLPLVKSALNIVNPNRKIIIGEEELSTEASSVLVIDSVVDRYQELLHEEFNN